MKVKYLLDSKGSNSNSKVFHVLRKTLKSTVENSENSENFKLLKAHCKKNGDYSPSYYLDRDLEEQNLIQKNDENSSLKVGALKAHVDVDQVSKMDVLGQLKDNVYKMEKLQTEINFMMNEISHISSLKVK